jgi:hypothetical protein
MPICDKCGKEYDKLQSCPYCKKSFCEQDYVTHMAWERKYAGLAEETAELYRKKRT